MKKMLCVLLCVALAFSLVACGNGAADKGNGAASSANSDASDASVTDKKTSGKKHLLSTTRQPAAQNPLPKKLPTI